MSTYQNEQFGSKNYSKFRPTYPDSLYKNIVEYYQQGTKAPLHLTVDFGCGTGQATQEWINYSELVVAVDPSEVMVRTAEDEIVAPNVSFKVGGDDQLDTLFEPQSVDLLAIAEAAHWFQYPRFWEQAARVIRPGGVLAIWGYFTPSYPDYPVVDKILYDYANSPDKCGPYWDPGNEIVQGKYRALEKSLPRSKFMRIEYRHNTADAFRPDDPFELVKFDTPVQATIDMLKTWSPYFNWKRHNPGKPDIADRVMQEITAQTGLKAEDKVNMKWDTFTLLATRK